MNEINDKLNKMFVAAKDIGLQDEKKSALRHALLRHTETVIVKSPYLVHILAEVFKSRLAGTFAAFFLMKSGGLTYASTHALPAEPLSL